MGGKLKWHNVSRGKRPTSSVKDESDYLKNDLAARFLENQKTQQAKKSAKIPNRPVCRKDNVAEGQNDRKVQRVKLKTGGRTERPPWE